ncbi:MAG: hypothetical protein RR795_01355 [Cetobacterium sp.]|uniref:hypothetical protein n=1 Tax=Cetobacterium sp. TaxID=2071632 RepID=UPI002FCC47A4
MGKLSDFLKLYTPDIGERGTIITDVIRPAWEKIDNFCKGINEKTGIASATKAGIVKIGKTMKNYEESGIDVILGTSSNEALEGKKLAEILGIEYGGLLNSNSQKYAGVSYYDTANKSIFKCIRNTSINYADAGYFTSFSNDDLLMKLENLIQNLGIKKIEIGIFQFSAPSSIGNTKTINFRNRFTKIPFLFVSQTTYNKATDEWVAVQTSGLTNSNFVARHAGGTSDFTPNFYYIAIETLD